MAELFERLANILLRLWQQGETFLWSIAATCAAIFAILCVGWVLNIGSAPTTFESYRLVLFVAAVAFGILAIFRTGEGRPPRTVHLIADDNQSFWGQSRQKDGRVTTQFCFRMQPTNLTDGPIVLSTLRLLKPRVRRTDDELARHVLTRHPCANIYGSENLIMPQAISRASCDIILDRPIRVPGKKNYRCRCDFRSTRPMAQAKI